MSNSKIEYGIVNVNITIETKARLDEFFKRLGKSAPKKYAFISDLVNSYLDKVEKCEKIK